MSCKIYSKLVNKEIRQTAQKAFNQNKQTQQKYAIKPSDHFVARLFN